MLKNQGLYDIIVSILMGWQIEKGEDFMNKYKMTTICSLSIVCILILSLLLPLTTSANDKESLELKMHYEKSNVTVNIVVNSEVYTGVVCKYIEVDDVLTYDDLSIQTQKNGTTLNLNKADGDNYSTIIENVSKRYVVIYVSIGNCEICDYIDCKLSGSGETSNDSQAQTSNTTEISEDSQQDTGDTQEETNNSQNNKQENNENESTKQTQQNAIDAEDSANKEKEEIANNKSTTITNTESDNNSSTTTSDSNNEIIVESKENTGTVDEFQTIEDVSTTNKETERNASNKEETVNPSNNQSNNNSKTSTTQSNTNNQQSTSKGTSSNEINKSTPSANTNPNKNTNTNVNKNTSTSTVNSSNNGSTTSNNLNNTTSVDKDTIDMDGFQEIESIDKSSTADSKMPQTGEDDTIKIVGIVIFSIISVLSFYKYKKTK